MYPYFLVENMPQICFL